MNREDFNAGAEVKKISKWLREYNDNAGTNGYVIGLSGGIDSTLTAALAVEAVGKENVVGVVMPIYSPENDESDAWFVADFLGINVIDVNLKHTYNEMTEAFGSDLGRLEKANIRSRLRMVALYAIAGKRNMLVVGTGNKSEDTIGYFTKYGDGGVDILPIVEYYKWEVKKMAKYFEFPLDLVERTPTAALWEGQTDEVDIGMSYDVLDDILYYLERGDEYPIMYADKVDIVKEMIRKNKHKNNYPPSYRR